jgi:hypothetical protein
MEIQRASQVRETPCQPFKKPQNDNDYYFGATTLSITTCSIMTVTITTHTISDKNVTLSIKTVSLATLSIPNKNVTLRINVTQQNYNHLNNIQHYNIKLLLSTNNT